MAESLLAVFGKTTGRNTAALRIAATMRRTATERPWQRGLFGLTRLLRGLVSDRAAALSATKACADLLGAWCTLTGLAVSLDEIRAEFAIQWRAVRNPIGKDALTQALTRARRNPALPEAAPYDEPVTRLLVALCAELQRVAGPKRPFFLSAGSAADLCGFTDAKVAWRRLKLLEADGLIVVETPGTAVRATRYRWLPPLEPSGQVADET